MKKTFIFLLIFVIVSVQAQNYKISFAGNGASTKVDSVKVENLTQCTNISLRGGDTLNLEKVITGINEINNSTDNTLQIYPNPMTGYCLIEFVAPAQGETTIELYDIAGKRITQVQESLMKGEHKYSLSGIGSGIYVLKVESNQYEYSAKIVSTNSTSSIAEISHIETAPASSFQTPASNTGAMKSLKNNKLIGMQYTTGDTLKLTGYSAGKYATVSMLVPAKSQTDTFNFIKCTDADSNHYAVVQIGTQIWMAENLKTTKYNNGTAIPNVTDGNTWILSSTPAYCWYGDSIQYKNTYGALYNWYAADTSKLCPTGWHVPDTTEWTTLITYLGGGNIAGGKMKDTCSTYWDSHNTGATNSSGFTALPGGYRSANGGTFYSHGYCGLWWSASEHDATHAWYCYLYDGLPNAHLYDGYFKQDGLSVRCLKD